MQFLAGRGDKMWLPEIEFAAVASGHNTARLAHQKHAGGDVPRLNVSGPEGVERAASDIRQVERGRPGSAYALANLRGRDEV